MVRRLLQAVPELPRLRLSSIDAAELDGDLLRLVADTAITIGGTEIPVIVSLPVGLALAALAAWMVLAARR